MNEIELKKAAGIPVNENIDTRAVMQTFDEISNKLVDLQDEIYGMSEPQARNAAIQEMSGISNSLAKLKKLLTRNSIR